jgi:hypothetical protein
MLEEPFGGDPTWDGSATTFKVEWGGGHAKLYRNGGLLHDVDYSGAGEFGPDTQHFSLGTSRSTGVGSSGLPVGAVFSDVIVDGVEGPKAATCPGAGGTGGSAGSASGGSSGAPACDPAAPIAASLTPVSGSGKAGLFTIDYGHCQGAASLRVVQIWVADNAVDAMAPGVSLGFEGGKLYGAGSTDTCTPGEAKKLSGPYGALTGITPASVSATT